MSSKSKMKKLGVVLKGDKGPFVILGDSKNKNPQYNYTVELTVKNAEGETVTSLTNPLLTLWDPRKRPGITEEQLGKINDKVRYDVMVSES